MAIVPAVLRDRMVNGIAAAYIRPRVMPVSVWFEIKLFSVGSASTTSIRCEQLEANALATFTAHRLFPTTAMGRALAASLSRSQPASTASWKLPPELPLSPYTTCNTKT